MARQVSARSDIVVLRPIKDVDDLSVVVVDLPVEVVGRCIV